MEMPIERGAKDMMKLISTKQAIISSVFSTTARTNEDMLRKRQNDRMAELLTVIEDERARR